ncbi:MAG: 3-phosphoshikimate 1-carboxyvinyltransferase [Cyclobacteriaceae bacterium]
MSSAISLKSNGSLKNAAVRLSSSKSESNRALIINALAGNKGELNNLSDARDTETMRLLLRSKDHTLDVLDAGTTMRFLTAYLAVQKNSRLITGTVRMQQRPIKILVDALLKLGAQIRYLKNEGYPPLEIAPMDTQLTNQLKISANISSQYISALLMIAPILPKGLNLELTGEIYSEPYINMTLALMEHFGVVHQRNRNQISIEPQPYKAAEYTIESDWSGASYWYSFVSLSQAADIKLLGLRKNSFQGDQAIAWIMEKMGVRSEFEADFVRLNKSNSKKSLELDFRECPDLAQTVMVSAAAQKINLKMTGLESLKIKETDRVAALQNELSKMNVELIEDGNIWYLKSEKFDLKPDTIFETYEDHRMAMAFAPLSILAPITINEPDVVKKSYPRFWEHLKNVGVAISFN